MKIVILKDETEIAKYGARLIIEKIKSKSDAILGLATGSTVLPIYQELISAYRAHEISFSRISTFNLDEYLGLEPDHPKSYHQFMSQQLFNYIDIDMKNTFLPAGNAEDPLQECEDYEKLIQAKGGIDIQVLGIGRNGHIGFNEPSSGLMSRTRIKTLATETIQDNARFFKQGEFQPHLSITMGIGTILDAKTAIVLAAGDDKADAISAAIEGPVTASCPASSLQLHRNVVFILDENAASKLQRAEFYKHVEQENRKLLNSLRKT